MVESLTMSDPAAGTTEAIADAPLAALMVARPRPRRRERVSAALEVVLCSGFPTQLAIGALLALAGLAPTDGRLSLGYVSALLLTDATVVIGLVVWLRRLHGEPLGELLLGTRAAGREALLGLPLIFAAFGIAVVALLIVQGFAPWLRNVPVNPFQGLIQSGWDATIFLVVAILAGGLREEVSRAFALRRFERYLGGGYVGVVVFSVAFGAGHFVQGWDAMLTTGALGAFWGMVYLRRSSIVAPVVSHSGFNAAEIIRFAIWGS